MDRPLPPPPLSWSEDHLDDWYLDRALDQAKKGRIEGGIPIGAILVRNHSQRPFMGTSGIIGEGRNQRVQKGSAILHGEMDCLENAGRLSAADLRQCTLYTTLSPCPMCAGAILLYGIPRVVVGENQTFMGAEEHLRSSGVKVVVKQNEECVAMMRGFLAETENRALWHEDIGV